MSQSRSNIPLLCTHTQCISDIYIYVYYIIYFCITLLFVFAMGIDTVRAVDQLHVISWNTAGFSRPGKEDGWELTRETMPRNCWSSDPPSGCQRLAPTWKSLLLHTSLRASFFTAQDARTDQIALWRPAHVSSPPPSGCFLRSRDAYEGFDVFEPCRVQATGGDHRGL